MADKFVIRSGYSELDELTGGFRPGEVVCVVSRGEPEPGFVDSGASDFLSHTAYQAAEDGARVIAMAAHFTKEVLENRLRIEAVSWDQKAVVDRMMGKEVDLQAIGRKRRAKLDLRVVHTGDMELGAIEGTMKEYADLSKPCLVTLDGGLGLPESSMATGAAVFMREMRAVAQQMGMTVLVAVVDNGSMLEGMERRLDPSDMLRRRMPELESACDALLLVRPGKVVRPEDDIMAMITEYEWRHPKPICHVAKCASGRTGTVELVNRYGAESA